MDAGRKLKLLKILQKIFSFVYTIVVIAFILGLALIIYIKIFDDVELNSTILLFGIVWIIVGILIILSNNKIVAKIKEIKYKLTCKEEIKYKLTCKDYLEMYIHFQDKATSVKGAMFKTTTWIIGFASALIAFLFSALTKSDYSCKSLSRADLKFLVSLAGIVICIYALFAIYESAKHIRNNLKYAEKYAEKISGLKEVVLDKYSNNNELKIFPNIKIWTRLSIIAYLYLAAFVGILLWSLNKLQAFHSKILELFTILF